MDTEQHIYGRRKDDDMPTDQLTPEIIASLSDSQRMNVRIIQSLTNINNNISALNTNLTNIKIDVDNHEKILITGDNGRLSMQERMRNVENYLEGIRYWSRLVGGAILLQTITFGIATAIALVRILPLLEKSIGP